MKKLLVATHNRGKIRELKLALESEDIEVVGMQALDDPTPVDETGATFEENARIKAEEYSSRTDLPVLADDSGLEVDALGGAPGVHSARYGGDGLDDVQRNQKLLAELASITTDPAKRTARFRCVLALATAGTTLATFEGVVEGRILDRPRGSNGFGYDPLFFYPPAGCTTAEMSPADKQQISHRGKAMRALSAALREGRLTPAGGG